MMSSWHEATCFCRCWSLRSSRASSSSWTSADAVVKRTVRPFGQAFAALWAQVREQASQCWGQLLAAEAALAEVQEELGSGDAVHPAMRDYAASVRAGLERVRTEVRAWDRQFDYPTVDAETLELLRGALRRM